MKRVSSALLLAAALALLPALDCAAYGMAAGQRGGLQEAVDVAKDGDIIEISCEDGAESITVAGKAVIIHVIDGEWSENTVDTECVARLEGGNCNGAYYVVGDLDRCAACDTKAICGAEAACYELKESIKLSDDVTFANREEDTRGITVRRELSIDLNGCTIAQEEGENTYNAYAAVNVNIEDGTLTITDSSKDESGGIIGNTVAISVAEGECLLEGGSIASRGGYSDFGGGMTFAGAPVSITEGGQGFRMTGGRISMAELEEEGMLAGDFYDIAGESIDISGGEVFRVPESSLCTLDPTDGFYSYMFDEGEVNISGGYFDFEPDEKYIAANMQAVKAVKPGCAFAVTDGSPDPWQDMPAAQEEAPLNDELDDAGMIIDVESLQAEYAEAPRATPRHSHGTPELQIPNTGDRPLSSYGLLPYGLLSYRLLKLLRGK